MRKEDFKIEKEVNPNYLSPNQDKIANRRSHSFSLEPRSPSWNKANFNSSAMSSQSKNSKKVETSESESESDSESLASEKEICELDLILSSP